MHVYSIVSKQYFFIISEQFAQSSFGNCDDCRTVCEFDVQIILFHLITQHIFHYIVECPPRNIYNKPFPGKRHVDCI